MTKNVAHSVRDRLLKLSKERQEEFNFVLLRYGLERLLYRLAQSAHADEFILKGAMMFTLWSKHPHRATKDLDLLGFGSPSLDRLTDVFREVCTTEVEDDGAGRGTGARLERRGPSAGGARGPRRLSCR